MAAGDKARVSCLLSVNLMAWKLEGKLLGSERASDVSPGRSRRSRRMQARTRR